MERLFTEKEIHAKTGLTMGSLRNWRYLTKKTGDTVGPLFRKIRGRVYYRLKDVELFIEREAFMNAG